MAGPEHQMPAEDGRGRLRASHADRERVIDTLKAAYVYGLVTKEEFDARVIQTLAARTHAELAVITADIPAGLAPAPPPLRAAPAKASPAADPGQRRRERVVVATAVLAGLLFFGAFFAGGSMLPPLWAGAVGSALVSLLLAAVRTNSAPYRTRPGRQQPPRRDVRSGPGAGRRGASAASANQLPNASKPRRPGSADAARRHSLRPQISS
jgi:Domain of unknown function (DUF1707)